MAPMNSFRDVIAQWPSEADFAVDVGVPRGLVAVWKHRNSIPSNKWVAVAGAAARRTLPVTIEMLATLEARAA